eukprot:scaffold13088_cov56-Phaeocystis_antarctica.AAC.7
MSFGATEPTPLSRVESILKLALSFSSTWSSLPSTLTSNSHICCSVAPSRLWPWKKGSSSTPSIGVPNSLKYPSRFDGSGSSNLLSRAVAVLSSSLALRFTPLLRALSSAARSGVTDTEAKWCAEAQVVEHHAKRPQVIRFARHVLLEKRRVDLARVLVGGSEQDLGHLGRAEAGARDLVAKGLVNIAEDVEVDDLPRVAVADGVERLEVSVNAALTVHVIERQA